MQKRRKLGFLVDKLTNSIENTLTGEKFETEIVQLTKEDLTRLRSLTWAFDWTLELLESGREVHALVKKTESDKWQGLVSYSNKEDHLFMHLLESGPFNRGREKLYDGVAANLVAFVCKTSFERGRAGNIVFEAKTRLISHYEKTLGAEQFSHNRMFITTTKAYRLVKQYFPDFRL
jgi:hypothetical protein